MKAAMKKLVGISACALGLTYGASSAFADCSEMGNSQWQQLNLAMASAFDAGNYEEALNNGKRLSLICDRSPIVNFTMSEIYRRMDNQADAERYAKKATDYISEYPVPQALAERIWMRRAEYELPYKKQLEDLQAKTADYDVVKADYEARLEAEKEAKIRSEYLADNSRGNWWGTLWAGVGIMGGGLVMTIVGSVLIVKSDKVEFGTPDEKTDSGFKIRKPYVAGWTLLGLGLASTTFGAIMTGIAGYHYTHFNDQGEEDATVSFDVMPTSVAFGVTF